MREEGGTKEEKEGKEEKLSDKVEGTKKGRRKDEKGEGGTRKGQRAKEGMTKQGTRRDEEGTKVQKEGGKKEGRSKKILPWISP
jgi:hypothetical protein